MTGPQPADLLAAYPADRPEPTPGEHPAAPGSPLARQRESLRERRKKLAKDLHLDLAVPRYDPPVYVRFRPLTQGEIEAAQKRHEKSKDPDRTVIANAGLLANACIGVFEVDDEGEEYGIGCTDTTQPWPRFDEDLAREVSDAPLARASDIVRALYHTEGDVIASAARLTEWSGYETEHLERAVQGN